MKKRMMLLVNPNAGKGSYKTSLGGILQIFCDHGWQPTVFFTKAPGEAPGIVAANAQKYDMVTCIGGDGTLSEVASGMMLLGDNKRPIGYIPLGSTNDVARTLGLSPKPLIAAKNIMNGKPVSLDIGQFGTEDFFTYIAAFGAFTEVSYGTPQETKQALGHLAYMLEGIRHLQMIKDYHATVKFDGGGDDQFVEDDFIFGAVTNSTSVAGLVRLDADAVDLADGLFEVLLIKKPLDIVDTSAIFNAVLASDFSAPNIVFKKCHNVHFKFYEPVAWTRDGENGGTHMEIHVSNRHPGVEIIV